MKYTIIIFNLKSMKRERKEFSTEEAANSFFEARKNRNAGSLVCQPTEKVFTYRNEWNTQIHVQKMY